MIAGSNIRISGRCFWECADDFQWRTGTNHPTADWCPRLTACCHVLLSITKGAQTASCCQPWKGQSMLLGFLNLLEWFNRQIKLPVLKHVLIVTSFRVFYCFRIVINFVSSVILLNLHHCNPGQIIQTKALLGLVSAPSPPPPPPPPPSLRHGLTPMLPLQCQ